MALPGVFPGDFEDRTSTTMLLHAVGSLGSFIAFPGRWLPAAPGVSRTRKSALVGWTSLALVVASIMAGFLRSGVAPGLGQRIGFAFVFAWIGLVGYALVRSNRIATDA